MVLGLYYITKPRKGVKGEGLTFYGPEAVSYTHQMCIRDSVTTLLRAIGFEADQQILEIFDLADEVQVTEADVYKRQAKGREFEPRLPLQNCS